MTIHPLSLACLSLFFPGSGQLLAGRVGKAFYFAILALFMWVISMGFFGWIIHICAALDVWASETPDIEEEPPHIPRPHKTTSITWDPESQVLVYRDEDPEKEVLWH